jgi:SAM-dependent methyltransferase
VSTGYVTDTTYADTFFRELSPSWLNYVAALNGVKPQRLDRAFRYLELGCGFGTSSVVNAAAFPSGAFHACDLNEAHIASGRAYAERLGIDNIELRAQTFAALLADDLPPFDFIVLHGVYSWVDAATRDVIRQLLSRLLAPGGLVYVSYNALPGWSHELPLRKLLVELAPRSGTAAERSERAAGAMDALRAGGLRYFTANPGAGAAVDAYVRGEGHYLAHEFMNAAWEPFYGVDVGDEFASIGLQIVGSATLANNHLPLMIDGQAAEAISSLPSRRQQQLAIDFAINQRFRRDVFVRSTGARTDGSRLDEVVIGCPGDPETTGATMRVPRGEMRFQEPFIRDLRALMSRGSFTFRDVVAMLAADGQDVTAITRNLLFLIAGGSLAPFARAYQADSTPPSSIATPVVERALADAAAGARPRAVIPSTTYGNGIELDAADARALLEWSQRPADRSVAFDRRLATYARLGLVS